LDGEIKMMKEFIQYWKGEKVPKKLQSLVGPEEFLSYIPRDYMRDMRLNLKEGSRILIKSDLNKYNGILIVTKEEPKFMLYNVKFEAEKNKN